MIPRPPGSPRTARLFPYTPLFRARVPPPDEIFAAIQRAEAVQTAWAARPVAARLAILRRLRPALAADAAVLGHALAALRSEEHTSELQSLMRTSYAVFCLKKKNNRKHLRDLHPLT